MLEQDGYYMNLAVAVSARANCSGRKVGAVLVARSRVVATGYNGTPEGFTNCMDGGCWRCAESVKNEELKGQKYDLCICVHAEQNALLMAAREGIHTADTTIYTTMQPCFGCLKEALQAGVSEIIYLDAWGAYDTEDHLAEQYEALADHLPQKMRQLAEREDVWPATALGASSECRSNGTSSPSNGSSHLEGLRGG